MFPWNNAGRIQSASQGHAHRTGGFNITDSAALLRSLLFGAATNGSANKPNQLQRSEAANAFATRRFPSAVR